MAQTKNGQRAAQLSPVPLVCDEGETQEPELEAGSALWLQLLTWSTGQQQHRESQIKHTESETLVSLQQLHSLTLSLPPTGALLAL